MVFFSFSGFRRRFDLSRDSLLFSLFHTATVRGLKRCRLVPPSVLSRSLKADRGSSPPPLLRGGDALRFFLSACLLVFHTSQRLMRFLNCASALSLYFFQKQRLVVDFFFDRRPTDLGCMSPGCAFPCRVANRVFFSFHSRTLILVVLILLSSVFLGHSSSTLIHENWHPSVHCSSIVGGVFFFLAFRPRFPPASCNHIFRVTALSPNLRELISNVAPICE